MRLNILATVVTFNRKDLLLECLLKLKNSAYPCDILIVDNASTDGTQEAVASFVDNENIFYVNTGENLGGAGGFNFALKQAVVRNYDYAWLMDDDTMVHPDALEKLIDAAGSAEHQFGFLASYVEFTDSTSCLMNVPGLTDDWHQGIGINRNMLKVERATFVSLLIPTQVIKVEGLPIKEFFIWSDDTEYTRRLSKKYPCYLVTDSVVTHKMLTNGNTDWNQFIKEETERVDRYFYRFRNTYYLRKQQGVLPTLRFTARLLQMIGLVLVKSPKLKAKKISVILRGIIEGVKFNPRVEYPTIKP